MLVITVLCGVKAELLSLRLYNKFKVTLESLIIDIYIHKVWKV